MYGMSTSEKGPHRRRMGPPYPQIQRERRIFEMGVGGFWSFLRAHASGCFAYEDEHPLDLEGLRFCVDGTMLLTSALKSTITLEDETWIPAFVGSVLKRLERVIKLTGRCPIVVVDGDHPECKSHAHVQRTKARLMAEKKFAEGVAAGDVDASLKAKRAACRVNDELEGMVLRALVAAGVEVEKAPGEAEDRCAQMCLSGEAWGVVGEDGDTLICGAPWLLRGICQGGRLCLVGRDKMLTELNISPKQLRWLAALSGTDFHPGVPQVGPTRARKLLLPYLDPDIALVTIVKDASLHPGLRLAVRQFGDWDTCITEGTTGIMLEAIQRNVLATLTGRVGEVRHLRWEGAATSLLKRNWSGTSHWGVDEILGAMGALPFGPCVVVIE